MPSVNDGADISEVLMNNLLRIKVNAMKESYESMGIDYGETKNTADYKNYLVENPIKIGGEGGGEGDGPIVAGNITGWMDAVHKMAEWFQQTGYHYTNGATGPTCPLVGSVLRPDCSGFVHSCLALFLHEKYHPYSTANMIPGEEGYDHLIRNGFSHRRLSSEDDKKMGDRSVRWTILKCGDIVRHTVNGYGSTWSGHTYVIGENNTRYEMGGLNGRSKACTIPYADYRDAGALSGKYHTYDIFTYTGSGSSSTSTNTSK